MAKFDVNNVSVETLLGYVKDGTIAIPEVLQPYMGGIKVIKKGI